MMKMKLFQVVVALVPLGLFGLLGSRSAFRDPTAAPNRGRSGAACAVLRHEDTVRTLAFSPDGKLLATGEGVQTPSAAVRVWDVVAGRERACFHGHRNWVSAVCFTADGRMLCSASYESLRTWDVDRGEERSSQRWDHVPLSLAFHPDGRTIATMDHRGVMGLWDAAGEREPVRTIIVPSISHIAFSAGGRWMATAASSGAAHIRDAATGAVHRSLSRPSPQARFAVALSPDGHTLALGGRNPSVRFWDVRTDREWEIALGHDGLVQSLAFSPDGKLLAAGDYDGGLKVWDVATGRELVTLDGHDNSVNALAFSPDGALLASASSDRTVRLWRMPDRPAAPPVIALVRTARLVD